MLKLETSQQAVLERPRLGSMQRPVRLDALSRAVLRKLRVAALKKLRAVAPKKLRAAAPKKLRVAAPKKLRVAALKKLRVAALKKLRVAALQKPSPAAREKPVRLRLPSLVVAGKRVLGPNRLLLLQAIISCLQSGIYPVKDPCALRSINDTFSNAAKKIVSNGVYEVKTDRH